MSYVFRGQGKKTKHRRVWRWLLILVIFLVVIFLGKTTWQVWQKGSDLAQTVEDLQQQKNDLEIKKAKLEGDLKTINQADYLERVAREELNLQKPGEKAITFINPPASSSLESEVSPNGWQKFWQNIKNWFIFQR